MEPYLVKSFHEQTLHNRRSIKRIVENRGRRSGFVGIGIDLDKKVWESMREHFKYLSIILLVVVSILIFIPAGTVADFGDFSGDSDYGGGWDSGGGYDYDSGDSYGGGGSSSFSGPGEVFIFLIFAVISFYFMYRPTFKKSGKNTGRRPPSASPAKPTTGLYPVITIKKWDPDFSAERVAMRLSNLYVQMQNCWTARDITPLRRDFTNEQFAQYDRQLQRYRTDGQTPVIERIAVLDVTLAGAKQSDTHDILVANLSTRITTYTVDDKTGRVVRGSKNQEKFMTYEWTLIRPRGSQTTPQNKDSAFNCPNCNAPVNINQSAQCPFCGSVITKTDYDWVISGIKGISQRTV